MNYNSIKMLNDVESSPKQAAFENSVESLATAKALEYTDEEHFETSFNAMLNRVAEEQDRECPASLEDLREQVEDRARKDATRIINGETTYHVTAPRRNLLRASNTDRESQWFGLGEKFYKLYCTKVQERVKLRCPRRAVMMAFPDW